MTLVTQHITGQLIPKRVAAYMKKAHKDVPIRVERCQDDENAMFISDGSIMVKVPISHPDMYPYNLFREDWLRMTFPAKEVIPQEGGADCGALWRSWGISEMRPLVPSRYLYEKLADRGGQSGTLLRQFTFTGTNPKTFETPDFITSDERYKKNVLIEKARLDVFSPDMFELEGFLFETSGPMKPVRVSAVNGIVAYVMPQVKPS